MTIPGIYCQRDARWSNDVLGNNPGAPWTLYGYGCLVSSISNMIWTVTGDASRNPKWANEWVRNFGGFTPGGGLVVWSVLDANLSAFDIQGRGFTGSLDETNNFLSPEQNYAIAWLSKPGFPQHWALMPYVGLIADPWDGKLKPVGSYTFHGAHLYTHVLPQVVTPPAPVVEAIPEIPVIVAPTVPVASTETPVENPHPETETTPTPDPAVPEYQTTWQHWDTDHEMTIVREGAYAFDAETGTKVTDIGCGDTRTYAGSFTTGGVQMVRTRFSANSAKWVGVPASFFTLDGNYVNAPLPVKQMSEEEHTKLTQTFVADVQQTATIWRKLLELLFEHIAKKLNKGKV